MKFKFAYDSLLQNEPGVIDERNKYQINFVKIVGIFSAVVSIPNFINEYLFYKTIWDPTLVTIYITSYLIYLVALILIIIRSYQLLKKDIIQNIDRDLIIYSSMFIITGVVFIVTFIARLYHSDIILVSAPMVGFAIPLMLTDKERLIYLIYCFILFSVGCYLVISDTDELVNIVPKALGIATLFYFAGHITYKSYVKHILHSHKLESFVEHQKETLHFLSNELGIDTNKSNNEHYVDQDLIKVNKLVNNLILKITHVKKDAESALKTAEEASKVKEKFLASMSHEIRTPLNILIGLTRELSKESLTQTQKTYIKHSKLAADHLSAIVNNILDISKIESGEIVIQNEPLSLPTLASNIKSLLSDKASYKNVNFQCTLDDKLHPSYFGDELRLRQILINLIDNAIKFTQKGSIELNISVKNSIQENDHIEITVNDTGMGMTEEFVQRIFDRFSQEPTSQSNFSSGTGLGMSISKELIHLMDGAIEVKSKLNEGTKVTISLPMQRDNTQEQTLSKDLERYPNLSNYTILVVDDNDISRLIARKILERSNCTIYEAAHGQEALDLIAVQKIDLVLLDINMPVLGGIETAKHIRNDLQLTIPIIAFTANAFKNNVDEYIQAGMNSYVTKPFEEVTLFKVILNALEIPVSLITGEETMKSAKTIISFTQLKEITLNDEELTKQFLSMLKTNLHEANKDIEKLLVTNELPPIAEIFHSIKPNVQLIVSDKSFLDLAYLSQKSNVHNEDYTTKTKDTLAQIQELLKEIGKHS